MGNAEQEFTAFYDATWARTIACAYALTGDVGAAEEAAQEAQPCPATLVEARDVRRPRRLGASGRHPAGHQSRWDGAESTSYALTSPSGKTEHLWMARTDSTFGMLWVVQASEPVPEGNDTAVMTALVSALQWPGSYQDVGATSGSASSSSAASVSETGFARALAGWSSGWKQQGGTDFPPTTVCGTDRWSEGSNSGSGSSLGANGDQEFTTFASPAQAASAARLLAEQLRTCTDTGHDVHTVAISDGGNVVVAVGGANGTVWWIVQKGSDVGYIEIPASATPRPDSVSAAVGSMLSQVISGNQASSTEQGGDPDVSASSVAPAP